MRKTKALSGAAQDAYFRRVLRAHPSLPAAERDQLMQRLKREIAQLRVRSERLGEGAAACRPTAAAKQANKLGSPAPAKGGAPAQPGVDPLAFVAKEPFDPFSPNVIVVLRTAGRGPALAALASIDSVDQLRLLAREQRLNVRSDLSSAAELRAAIVSAAEQRIANRVAAAS
ncbi:MAG TPA: hypothetical protein VHI72_02065 [Hyphomicrobiaceae bacterium]|nr:hypothetical protein [Hyphomicrobiaceae bacterium]